MKCRCSHNIGRCRIHLYSSTNYEHRHIFNPTAVIFIAQGDRTSTPWLPDSDDDEADDALAPDPEDGGDGASVSEVRSMTASSSSFTSTAFEGLVTSDTFAAFAHQDMMSVETKTTHRSSSGCFLYQL